MKVRQARQSELDTVFLMGYDAWGAGLPVHMYLESCLASYKYKLGEFYVLVNDLNEPVSSCIVYPLSAFGGVAGERAIGIGSLATAEVERHKGYATLLMTLLMKNLEAEGVDAFFIHSDIYPRIYEKLGFAPAPSEYRKKSEASVPMLRLSGNRTVSPAHWQELIIPSYF